jgi:hypothetical protein
MRGLSAVYSLVLSLFLCLENGCGDHFYMLSSRMEMSKMERDVTEFHRVGRNLVL